MDTVAKLKSWVYIRGVHVYIMYISCKYYIYIMGIIYISLQIVLLERPACFAFPEWSSSWHKYYQPTDYH